MGAESGGSGGGRIFNQDLGERGAWRRYTY